MLYIKSNVTLRELDIQILLKFNSLTFIVSGLENADFARLADKIIFSTQH